MRSVFRLSISAALFAAAAFAQLPDGPGKAETQKVCSQCHEIARSVSLRQDRAGWQTTINKMVDLGADATNAELGAVLNYLSTRFPADSVPRINVNTCRAIDLEAGISLRRSQAAAVIAYREKNGPFHSVEDLKKVPGIDAATVDAKKDRLTFQ
jgi:competence protein ComEA